MIVAMFHNNIATFESISKIVIIILLNDKIHSYVFHCDISMI